MTSVSCVYVLLLLVNVIILAFKWYSEGLGIPFKILTAVLLLALALELFSSLFLLFSHQTNNLFFYHIYNPIEFVLYSLFFISLSKLKGIRDFVYILIPIFLGFVIFSSFFLQKLTENNSYVVLIESIVIIFYCLLYLWYINVYEIENRAERNPYFWVTIGIMLYFTGSLFLEGFLHLLMNHGKEIARLYNKIGFVFKYLMCVMCLVGILKSKIPTNKME